MSTYSVFKNKYTSCNCSSCSFNSRYLPSRTQNICPSWYNFTDAPIWYKEVTEPYGSFSIRAAVRPPYRNGYGCVGCSKIDDHMKIAGLT